MGNHDLFELDDSILVIIDVQEFFLQRLPHTESEALVGRIAWLANMATRLGIPIVGTAEDIDKYGSLVTEILESLPSDTPIHNKMSFGLAADPAILASLETTGRRSVVVVGMETDVCVCQSAIGLIEKGFRVAALGDAVATPAPGQQVGLDRMRHAGVVVSSVKGMYYEWIRTVEASEKNQQVLAEIGLPPGTHPL